MEITAKLKKPCNNCLSSLSPVVDTACVFCGWSKKDHRKIKTKRRRNIRTLPANRMEYLLGNYPADAKVEIGGSQLRNERFVWLEETVLKAMQAAFNAGRRDRREEQ